jgi:hypothetical protein
MDSQGSDARSVEKERIEVIMMKIPWKYWGPLIFFIIISVLVWIFLRLMDFYFDVLIWACFIMMVLGGVLFIIALIPLVRWVVCRSKHDQNKRVKNK